MSSLICKTQGELCFDKETFFDVNFAVDNFVCEKRRAVGLEQLRRDLKSHLKYLQERLVELINNDYTDFVNLSSNLVGLEKYIDNIYVPLNKLRDEVADINTLIDGVLRETEEKLAQRQRDRELKGKLLLAMQVYKNVQRLPRECEAFNANLVERTATQIHSLCLSLERCRDIALAKKSEAIISRVRKQLETYLESRFLHALENRDEYQLRHVFHVGIAIDCVQFIEDLYSQRIVKPALEEILTETVLREVLSDGLFNQVSMFVTTNTVLLNKCAPEEYNFVLRAVLPVFVSLAENRVPTLFSLTSATMFHVRYHEAQRFLETLEQHLPKTCSLAEFRTSLHYKAFMSKWSTGVYFQLRQAEIATNFETALLEGNEPLAKKSSSLVVTENLHKQFQKCWSDDVFIAELRGNFVRLTLRLISRYTTFFENWLQSTHGADEVSILQIFQAASDCQQLTVESICKSCGKNLFQNGPEFLQIFESCVKDAFVRLEACCNQLASVAISLLIQLAKISIKQVADIPRLYRRTNREIPNSPSTYVSDMLKPAFHSQAEIAHHWNFEWSIKIADEIAEAFLDATRGVLDSVRRMEDSLRKLKKVRVASSVTSATGALQAVGDGVMSDDDKIRRQILMDVEHFGILLLKFLGDSSLIPSHYRQLLALAKGELDCQTSVGTEAPIGAVSGS